MNAYVADTHALFWYLTGSPRLGPEATRAFGEGANGQAIIYIPAIVLAELYFLNEKAGHPLRFAQEFQRLRQAGQFSFAPLAAEDILDFESDQVVPEMHDRIVIGVARRMRATCISRDAQITRSGLVPTVW